MKKSLVSLICLVAMVLLLVASAPVGATTFDIADNDASLSVGYFAEDYKFSVPWEVIKKSTESPSAFCKYMYDKFIPDLKVNEIGKFETTEEAIIGKIDWEKEPNECVFKMHKADGSGTLIADVEKYHKNLLFGNDGDFIISDETALLFLFSDEKGCYDYLAIGLIGGKMELEDTGDDLVFKITGSPKKVSIACGSSCPTVPIPAGLWLLGSGLLGLIGVRRRKS